MMSLASYPREDFVNKILNILSVLTELLAVKNKCLSFTAN